MLLEFRWRCLDQPVVLVLVVEAASDRAAGELAAAALHDFVRGRARELRWQPLTPVVRNGG